MTTTVVAPTVLVADDEPDIRELARVYLELDGFEVVGEAVDGPEALDRYIALNPPPVPAALVLDNRMPGLTGLQVASMILERHPDQVIVLFTAFLDDDVEREARAIGVGACLDKLQAADLPATLRGLLGD